MAAPTRSDFRHSFCFDSVTDTSSEFTSAEEQTACIGPKKKKKHDKNQTHPQFHVLKIYTPIYTGFMHKRRLCNKYIPPINIYVCAVFGTRAHMTPASYFKAIVEVAKKAKYNILLYFMPFSSEHFLFYPSFCSTFGSFLS